MRMLAKQSTQDNGVKSQAPGKSINIVPAQDTERIGHTFVP